jgi:ABC-type bacteriocin/lantibiotic exporter with double-glycine peptidase domain
VLSLKKIDLFSGNIIDNIAVGDFSPNMELIIEICKSTGILEFIESMPNGFNTYLRRKRSYTCLAAKNNVLPLQELCINNLKF